MYILDAWGVLRSVVLFIDQIAYSLIDDAYNLIVNLSKAEIFNHDTIKSVMYNLYIVIGIFALFKIGLAMVNSIISPDKLTDKESGAAHVLRNFIIMFVILVATPFLFAESMELQGVIVKGNYINKLFGLEGASYDKPGDTFKNSAIAALIKPNKRYATLKKVNNNWTYVVNDATCKDDSTHCKAAIDDYNAAIFGNQKDHIFSVLINHIGDFAKDGNGSTVYIYDYTMIINFVVGLAITYILFLFAFDIGERAIKLAVLEVLSPLFIVTYIDPKAAKSGPFNNWLKEVGKTYASLYIRLATVSIMIVLVQLINQSADIKSIGFFASLIMVLALLIFAKQLPSWVAGMLGIKDFDKGFKGLGKRLGSAALVGAGLAKAGHMAGGAAAGAFHTMNANRRNRNNARRQIRKDEGLTHGSKGREKRQSYTGGYFSQRKQLHADRKRAYNDAGVGYGRSNKADGTKYKTPDALRQMGSAIVAGGILGGKAAINAKDMKGVFSGAKDASKTFAGQVGMDSRSVGNKISEFGDDIVSNRKGSWGSAGDVFNRQEQMANDKTARGITGDKYSSGLGTGKVVTGNGDFKKMADAVLKDPNKGLLESGNITSNSLLAAQYLINQGQAVDATGKIDFSDFKFDGTNLMHKKVDSSGNVSFEKITDMDSLQKDMNGVMDPTSKGMVMNEQFLNIYQNNALNQYQQNEQARTQAIQSYQEASSNIEKLTNNINAMKPTLEARLSAYVSGIDLSDIPGSIEKINSAISAETDPTKRQELINLKGNSGLGDIETFTPIRDNALNSMNSINNAQKDLEAIVGAIKGATVAEKSNMLTINSKKIEKKMKNFEEKK